MFVYCWGASRLDKVGTGFRADCDIVEMKNQVQLNQYYVSVNTWSARYNPPSVLSPGARDVKD